MSLKQIVGIRAAKYVEDGMIVDSGTGSITRFMTDEIGRRVKEEGLPIAGVTTPKEVEKQALALGIPLKSIGGVPYVDPTIDGAGEVSADLQGIKGGGAASLFEKIVATYSKRCIWIVDRLEMVDDLRAFPFSVEVVPCDSYQLVCLLKEEGYHPVLRLNVAGEILITDGGHYAIDLHLEKTTDPEALGPYLGNLVGAVEHGLFLSMISMVAIGYRDGPKTLYVPVR